MHFYSTSHQSRISMGLEFSEFAIPRTVFLFTEIPYLGRNGQKRETNIGRNTAIALASPYFGSGRNLTVDNFFTRN